jgi:hypothetical protein
MRLEVIGAIAVMAIGCAPSERTVVGRYRGEAVSDKSAGTVANNLAKGFSSTMSLELRGDKTFHLVAMVVPLDGKWSMSGDTLTLTADKVMGFERSDVPVATGQVMKFRFSGGKLEPLGTGPERRFKFVKELSNDSGP